MLHDLLVVGGGPVGASLARAVRGSLRTALLAHDGAQRQRRGTGKAFDARVYALSPGNVEFLRAIGAWGAIPGERLAPVHAMRVFGDDGSSCIEFDAYDAGVPELAWIVEDAALQEALWSGLDVEVLPMCDEIAIQADKAVLTLRDGTTAEGKLVVGADGANSLVRRAAGIADRQGDYGQSAVVANFHCDKPHHGTAFQWFQGGPVLALLPLPGNQVSMVWSLPTSEAERIGGLAPDALCREVEAASARVLGELSLAASQRSYALRHLSAKRIVGPRVALAGDAAHVIHPLAGQGLNLGLQDARALAGVLGAREPVRDPGDLRLLRRYERSRAEPVLAMGIAVEGLYRLFGSPGREAGRVRNAGLNLANRSAVLKNVFIRQALR